MASWQEPVIDLLQKFGDNPASLWPLLEILTVLPEEVNSRFLRLGANRRQNIVTNFTNNGNGVLEFLVCIHIIDILPFFTFIVTNKMFIFSRLRV